MDSGIIDKLTQALIAFREKAWGDSNDEEIEAAQELAGIVEELLAKHGVDRDVLNPDWPDDV